MAEVDFRDHLADFRRDARIVLLSVMAVVIGVIGALIAAGLLWLIAVISNLCFYHKFSGVLISPAAHQLRLSVALIPAIGGLIIGVMARFGSDKIRGHGIPEALEAILIGRSRMDAKVAVLKPISSAISIGTGGPFGAEGPIIMTGGAFGSLFAQLFHLSSAERKTLLVAGAAAGMAAVFNTPVAAVLLAVELLLFEWKPRSVVPVGIAAIVSTAVRMVILGSAPVFPVPPHAAPSWEIIIAALGVGLVSGIGSGALTFCVYFFEDAFARLPIHWMWWPTIGGLGVGLGALFNPRVLGVGYDVIAELLSGKFDAVQAARLLVAKGVVWSIALGSGTSGGVLAPLLMMGACLGAIEAKFLPFGDTALWATLGMASMMGGTMRSPLTAIVFTLELTHDINILPALLSSCIMSYLFTVLVLRRSILTEKVARHGHHITREYSIDPLDLMRTEEVMRTPVATIKADTPLSELTKAMSDPQNPLSRQFALAVVDGHDDLVGIVTRGDIVKAVAEEGIDGQMSVLEAGSNQLIVTYPRELLSDAVAKMVLNDIGRLPVVDAARPNKLLGIITRSSVLEARRRFMKMETDREALLVPPRKQKLSKPIM